MESLRRIVSRPQAKPYRSRNISYDDRIHVDDAGLLKWSPDDIENPKQWSPARRWFITLATIVIVMNGSMASSSPSGCLESISGDLGVSEEVAKLTVTLFLAGYMSGPSLWAPLSEYYGRRPILYLTFVCYYAFTFLCAFTPNIGGLLVGRFFAGTFISGVIANGPGVFVDLWGPVERGISMMLYSCALQLGPAIGPVTSGFYQLKLDWRWNFYQLLWFGGFALLIMPSIPETLPSVLLQEKARRIRAAKLPGYEDVRAPIEADDKSLFEIFKIALTRPWIILFDPIALLIAIYITVVYSLLYMLFTIFPIVFIQKRGWNSGVGELPLLSVCVGSVIGGLYLYWDSVQKRKKIAAGHKPCPEDALTTAMTSGILFPIAMFWFAWSGEYNSVPWIVPTLAGVAISVVIVVLFVAYLTYLSESYLTYAASAQAANTIVRSAVAAAAPLYTQQMFNAMGVGGGGSLIGGVAVLLAPIPFLFYRYGAKIRQRSKFAPTSDPDEHEDETNKEKPRTTTLNSFSDKSSDGEVVEDDRESQEQTRTSATYDSRYIDSSGLERAE